MENLLQILSSLISFTTQHFADVAHVVMKREENKVETISTCRNDVYTGNEALRNWQFHVGEKLPVSSPLQPDPLRRHSAFPRPQHNLPLPGPPSSSALVRQSLLPALAWALLLPGGSAAIAPTVLPDGGAAIAFTRRRGRPLSHRPSRRAVAPPQRRRGCT
jgi:hypothetical protein